VGKECHDNRNNKEPTAFRTIEEQLQERLKLWNAL